MVEKSIAKKLLLKPGMKALILNAPQGFMEGLDDLPTGIQLSSESAAGADFVLLYIKDSAELNQHFELAHQSVIFDGLFWIAYPKGSSKIKTDVNRDILWKILKSKGIRPVAMISIDDTWSAMRFRPVKNDGGLN
jgi:hypothetical protein